MTDRMRSSSPRSTFLRPSVLCIALAAALQAGSAWALEPFVLKDIRVEGLQRGDAGTVFASLPFRIGDTYTDEVRADQARAVEIGITGVPFFLVDGRFAIPGAQDPETMRITLERAWKRADADAGS